MMYEPLRPVDFLRLKNEVPIERVLELTDWQLIEKSGANLRGPCPLHGSTSLASTSFAVNIELDAFKCFKCQASGNQLDLAAAWFGIEHGQVVRTAIRLCRELGIEVPRK